MYRILIVDNERIVVDSLLYYFEEAQQAELEAVGSYSSAEALSMMERMRVDILLADIRMPGMDGLALQREVIRRWPWCRTIFLTGYDDFHTIQEALRLGGADYLLKSEGKAAILGAVRKVVGQLNDAAQRERLEREARQRLEEAMPLIRGRFLRDVVKGRVEKARLEERFSALHIPLNAERPVYPILVKIDALESGDETYDLSVMALDGLMQTYFGERANAAQVECAPRELVWLLSPGGAGWAEVTNLRAWVEGSVERAQQAARQAMGLSFSACLALEPVPWEALHDCVGRLLGVFHSSLRLEESSVLFERAEAPSALLPADVQAILKRGQDMKVYLAGGNRIKFFEAFQQIAGGCGGLDGSARASVRLEVACLLIAMLSGHINESALGGRIAERFDLQRIASWVRTDDWEGVMGSIRDYAQAVFDAKSQAQDAELNDFIDRIHWYVENNLGGDLSMTRIGEIVNMNPYYMSRVYQLRMGEGLKSYIARLRLDRAKALLRETDMTVRDIAQAVGFLSEQAFHRFFKSLCATTPQAYRRDEKG